MAGVPLGGVHREQTEEDLPDQGHSPQGAREFSGPGNVHQGPAVRSRQVRHCLVETCRSIIFVVSRRRRKEAEKSNDQIFNQRSFLLTMGQIFVLFLLMTL